ARSQVSQPLSLCDVEAERRRLDLAHAHRVRAAADDLLLHGRSVSAELDAHALRALLLGEHGVQLGRHGRTSGLLCRTAHGRQLLCLCRLARLDGLHCRTLRLAALLLQRRRLGVLRPRQRQRIAAPVQRLRHHDGLAKVLGVRVARRRGEERIGQRLELAQLHRLPPRRHGRGRHPRRQAPLGALRRPQLLGSGSARH
ncbi:hypothetical protein FA09DRAFT_356216, partial [Tilletiopsis washingtonensis]